VFEAVAEGLGALRAAITEYHELVQRAGAGDEAVLSRLAEIQSQLEAGDGWSLKARVEATISRLGLEQDALTDTLSGGQRKRVALARALVVERAEAALAPCASAAACTASIRSTSPAPAVRWRCGRRWR
jgi:ATP-binding cassette subfamily F protein uup